MFQVHANSDAFSDKSTKNPRLPVGHGTHETHPLRQDHKGWRISPSQKRKKIGRQFPHEGGTFGRVFEISF